MTVDLTRRNFIIAASATLGAFTLGFRLAPATAQTTSPDEINAWLTISPDETVLIRITRAEMGQGSMTGLAQMLAEELDCDWAKVKTDFVLPGASQARADVYGDFQTGGSGSIRELQQTMRQAGATARDMLISAAAAAWKVNKGECAASNGVVSHRGSGRSTSFGRLAKAASGFEPATAVELKDPKHWRLIGKSIPRLEALEKVTAKVTFGIDVSLPGMLHAAVRMAPNAGGSVQSFEAAAISSRPGVRQVFQVDARTIAVIADGWWQAETAIADLPVIWDESPSANVSSASIALMLSEGLETDDPFTGMTTGNVTEGLGAAVKTISAEYAFPYQAHAPLEPINATAVWTPERCEIWASTQDAGAMLDVIVDASGLPASRCEVHRTFLGGGFGRRLYSEFAHLAVLIAKARPGVPVKMIWSRQEDMTHDLYHPTTRAKLVGGLDKDGNLLAFHIRVAGQSIRAVHAPRRLQGNGDPHMLNGLNQNSFNYSIPTLLVDLAMRNPPIMPGAWRGVHVNQNVFYVESFIDELALAAGRDPLEFRRPLLRRNPKLLAVLEAAAERIGWSNPQPNRHHGIAGAFATESYVAAAAEVSIVNGALKIHRMVCAIDCGIAVNPGLISRQLEGGLAFGLSAALFGECTVDKGAIQETNFDGYAIVRMNDMPPIETIVMPSGGFWGGVGEPPVVVAAPALFNAVSSALGRRIRSLPLKNHKLVGGA